MQQSLGFEVTLGSSYAIQVCRALQCQDEESHGKVHAAMAVIHGAVG